MTEPNGKNDVLCGNPQSISYGRYVRLWKRLNDFTSVRVRGLTISGDPLKVKSMPTSGGRCESMAKATV